MRIKDSGKGTQRTGNCSRTYCFYQCILLKGLAIAEQGIAERIFSLQRGELFCGKIDAQEAIKWVEAKTKVDLSSSQKKAIEKILWSRVAVIIGGQG